MKKNDNPELEHVREVEDLKDEVEQLKEKLHQVNLNLFYFAAKTGYRWGTTCQSRHFHNIMDTEVFSYSEGFKDATQLVFDDFEKCFGKNPLAFTNLEFERIRAEIDEASNERHDEDNH